MSAYCFKFSAISQVLPGRQSKSHTARKLLTARLSDAVYLYDDAQLLPYAHLWWTYVCETRICGLYEVWMVEMSVALYCKKRSHTLGPMSILSSIQTAFQAQASHFSKKCLIQPSKTPVSRVPKLDVPFV